MKLYTSLHENIHTKELYLHHNAVAVLYFYPFYIHFLLSSHHQNSTQGLQNISICNKRTKFAESSRAEWDFRTIGFRLFSLFFNQKSR